MSSKSEETKNIAAVMIIEVIGRPPEHLTETLDDIVKRIDEENGVSVKKKKINEPVLMKKDADSSEKIKEQEDFYISFAEVEVEVEEILYLTILMFKYMPAHIEIISPELIALTNNGWNDILNELTRRLHGYDEIARVLQVERGILEKKLKSVLEEKKK
jgi:hypothetical protein